MEGLRDDRWLEATLSGKTVETGTIVGGKWCLHATQFGAEGIGTGLDIGFRFDDLFEHLADDAVFDAFLSEGVSDLDAAPMLIDELIVDEGMSKACVIDELLVDEIGNQPGSFGLRNSPGEDFVEDVGRALLALTAKGGGTVEGLIVGECQCWDGVKLLPSGSREQSSEEVS